MRGSPIFFMNHYEEMLRDLKTELIKLLSKIDQYEKDMERWKKTGDN